MTKRQTMVDRTLHRTVETEYHEPNYKPEMNQNAPKS